MPSRRYEYVVTIDSAQGRQAARDLRAIFQRELGQINVGQSVRGGAAGGSTAAASGGFLQSGLGRAAIGGLAGFATVAGVQQLSRTAMELATMGSQLERTEQAATALVGSQSELERVTDSYRAALRGTATEGEAHAAVLQLSALGFADSTRELREFTRATQAVTMVNPALQGDAAQQQLMLTLANQSKLRLDQLGLSIEAVGDRSDELKARFPQLSTEMAFQQAVLGLLNERYVQLTGAMDESAAGAVVLSTNLRQLRENLALAVNETLDPVYRALAISIGDVPLVMALREISDIVNDPIAQMNPFTEGIRDSLQGIIDFAERVDAAVAGGAIDPDSEIVRGLTEIANEAADTGRVSDETATRLAALSTALDFAGHTIDMHSEALYAEELAAEAAALRTDAVTAALDSLAVGIAGSIAGAAAQLFSIGMTFDQVNALAADMQAQADRGLAALAANPQMSDQERLIAGQFIAYEATEPARLAREEHDARLRAIREQERAAERGAREAQRDWERATEQMARDFENALSAVPGLFGTSDVTQGQMDLAEMGVGQDFADNYLRRLTDEVMNKVDWADVDIGDAARRGGIDASLPAEAILELFRGMWSDSSLFADKANLDLINQDAVGAAMQRQERGKEGRANILAMFGLEGESDPALADAGMVVLSGVQQGIAQGMATQEGGAGAGMIDNLLMQFTPEALGGFENVGRLALAQAFGGWTAEAGSSPWVGVIVSAATEQVMSLLGDSLGEP